MNRAMKTNEAPEKLWINPQLDLPKLNGVMDKNSVQYVRKDVFIDKACKWWGNEFKTHEMQYEDSKSWYNDKVERFKQAMKGE